MLSTTRWAVLLGLACASLAACSRKTAVDGSSCVTDDDCVAASPSCAWRPGACTCAAHVCVFDASVALDPGQAGCRSCHGSLVNAAPPSAVEGAVATSEIGVGAHQSHLTGGVFSRPVACEECHLVPARVDDPGHIDTALPAEVTFGPLATGTGAASATWDHDARVCTSYCHGATLAGGSKPMPVWTTVDGTEAACGTCHGLPPGGSHPQSSACELCHAPTAGPGRTIANRATHIDGVLQAIGGDCGSCHGSAGNFAPPKGTHGETATSDLAVGAHQTHLQPSAIGAAVPCAECHLVPTNIGDPGHLNGVDDVIFGALAKTGGVAPLWNASPGTCAATYCHGNFKNGNTTNSPLWTAGSAGAACGTCHGTAANPRPGGTHPINDACATCHPGYTFSTVDVGLHLNGVLDTNCTCTSCHGTAGVNDAPPFDSLGRSATSLVTVGAHQGHVTAGTLRGAIACTECHPDNGTNIAHANLVIDMTFGGLANQGTTTLWSAGAATCAASYCHGGTTALSGGTRTTPVWTTVDGTQKLCTSCHGNPPPAPHPQNNACATCHPGATKLSATTGTVNVATHLNGTIDTVTLTCTTCHGTLGVNAAPPTDTTGASAANLATVGAHQPHVTDQPLRNALACTECHPDNGANMAHANGVIEVAFGKLSKAGTATVWNGTTCATGYCHGAFRNGNPTNTPLWTGGAPEGACGTCHGNPATGDPTPGGTHPFVAPATSCGATDCHSGYTRLTVNLAHHVNGRFDIDEPSGSTATNCGVCHNNELEGTTGVVAWASVHALGGADNPVDPGGAWNANGTLRASPSYASASCVSMCHPNHPHDLTSPATLTHENDVYADANARSATRDSTTRSSTDFDLALAGGGLCTNCHALPVDAGRPAFDATAYSTSAHDFTTNAQGTWSYVLHDGSTFGRNCTKCHSDSSDGALAASVTPFSAVHYSSNPLLLAGSVNPSGAPATFVCYGCHGNGVIGSDFSGKNVAALVAKTGSRHPVNSDAVHDSVIEDNAAVFGNTLGVAGRHANCLDCHNPHAAMPTVPMGTYTGGTASLGATAAACSGGLGTHCFAVTGAGTTWTAGMVGWRFALTAQGTWYLVTQVTSATQLLVYSTSAPTAASGAYTLRQSYRGTNVAGPALQGAWGAALTTSPAFWALPAVTNFTKKTIVANVDLEATLCFKCHSSFYGPLPTSPSGGYVETDIARAFNPANGGAANGSFHPVLASADANLGATDSVLSPWSRTSLMACSDCHESDGVADLNGPHGSSASFILKGPNTTWNTTLTTASTGMPAGTFCANCHSPTFAGSRFPDHTRSEHRIACTGCHVLIPHGAARPGLLIAVGTGGTPVGGVATTDVAPYATGARLGLKSYPANNTANWTQGNCGCNSNTSH